MLEIVIRHTNKDDLEHLPDLCKEGYRETNTKLMYETFDRLLDNDDYLFYSALLPTGELVGFVSVIVNHSIVEDCKDFAAIWSVRTKKIYRRKKIATRMFEYIENELKNKDIDFVYLITGDENIPAQGLYRSLHYATKKGYLKKI